MKITITKIEQKRHWQEVYFDQEILSFKEDTTDVGTHVQRILLKELGAKIQFESGTYMNTIKVKNSSQLTVPKLQAVMDKYVNTPMKVRFGPTFVTGSGLNGPKITLKTTDDIKKFKRERFRDAIVVWRQLELNLPAVMRDVHRLRDLMHSLFKEEETTLWLSLKGDLYKPSMSFYYLLESRECFTGDPWAAMKRMETEIKKLIV